MTRQLQKLKFHPLDFPAVFHVVLVVVSCLAVNAAAAADVQKDSNVDGRAAAAAAGHRTGFAGMETGRFDDRVMPDAGEFDEAADPLTEGFDRAIRDQLKRVRFSSFRSDLGKRSDADNEAINDVDAVPDIDLTRRAVYRLRGKAFKSDLGKRVRFGGSSTGMFRTDLGRRSAADLEELLGGDADEQTAAGAPEDAAGVEKRPRSMLFRSDLGKRSLLRRADYIRRMFRSDLGKRRMFRHDLG